MGLFNRTKFLVFSLVAVALIFQGCPKGTQGHLTGVQKRMVWSHPHPYGMINIPTGTFHMGQSDQDIIYALTSRPMQVTVQSIFMDDTEITNNEYRQFVHWVRDSIARKILIDNGTPEDWGKEITGQNHPQVGEYYIDWSRRIRYNDPEINDLIMNSSNPLYYQGAEIFEGNAYEFDVRKFIYSYEWFDINEAAKRKYVEMTRDAYEKNKGTAPTRDQFIRKETTMVYPDTLCWIRDFTYSFNEPLAQLYFYHPTYDDYPVVGVNWRQARAFCHWRTKYLNDYYRDHGLPKVNPFRLPTEAEWEYAARGGRDFSPYPWGGPYLRNSKGCFLANFKPLRGNYSEDGGYYPVKVTSYFPNDYGLYCMAGNVAEWTDNAYSEGINAVIDDMNPYYFFDADDPELNGTASATMKRKSIRGGSFKDVGYWLQNGTRSYEYQDTGKCYIGFRCVTTYMGRSIRDKNSNY